MAELDNSILFFDRDYFSDTDDNIYQTIGSLHPPKIVFALEKYACIKDEKKLDKILKRRKENQLADPISSVKKHQTQFWIQKETQFKYIRVLPNYSSKSAEQNINGHKFESFSTIYQIPMIQVPHDKIKKKWNPKERLQKLIDIVLNGDFNERKKLDSLEREAVEVALELQELFNIPTYNIGITGSLLWNGHHEKSDLDFMIYGKNNVQKFQKLSKQHNRLSNNKKGLRSYKLTEIEPLAKKMQLKTGLSFEDCFEYIYWKAYLLFHNNRKISITFAPNSEELIIYPLFLPNSEFHNLGYVEIEAQVIDDQWGWYYPGLFIIKPLIILREEKNFGEKKRIFKNDFSKKEENYLNEQNLPDKIRLLIFEHELIGYFFKGDKIRIKGLLQKVKNTPFDNSLTPKSGYQIFLGGRETFGMESIEKIEIKKKQ